MDIIVIDVEPHEVLSALIADNKGYEETCIFELIAPWISNSTQFRNITMANQDKGGYHKEHELKTSELHAVRENADEKVRTVIKYPFWHSNENGQ